MQSSNYEVKICEDDTVPYDYCILLSMVLKSPHEHEERVKSMGMAGYTNTHTHIYHIIYIYIHTYIHTQICIYIYIYIYVDDYI